MMRPSSSWNAAWYELRECIDAGDTARAMQLTVALQDEHMKAIQREHEAALWGYAATRPTLADRVIGRALDELSSRVGSWCMAAGRFMGAV